MRNISKKTKVFLIIVAVVGIVIGAILGYVAGSNTAAKANARKKVTEKVLNDDNKSREVQAITANANNKLEFVNYVKSVSDKFANGETNEYIITKMYFLTILLIIPL